ncbi:hypothetical protein GN956_G13595 [Arapaima gigas]
MRVEKVGVESIVVLGAGRWRSRGRRSARTASCWNRDPGEPFRCPGRDARVNAPGAQRSGLSGGARPRCWLRRRRRFNDWSRLSFFPPLYYSHPVNLWMLTMTLQTI